MREVYEVEVVEVPFPANLCFITTKMRKLVCLVAIIVLLATPTMDHV